MRLLAFLNTLMTAGILLGVWYGVLAARGSNISSALKWLWGLIPKKTEGAEKR